MTAYFIFSSFCLLCLGLFNTWFCAVDGPGLLQQLLSLKWTEPELIKVQVHYLDSMGLFLKYFPDAVGSVINKLFELLTSLPHVVKVYFYYYCIYFIFMRSCIHIRQFQFSDSAQVKVWMSYLIVCIFGRIQLLVHLELQDCRFVHLS